MVALRTLHMSRCPVLLLSIALKFLYLTIEVDRPLLVIQDIEVSGRCVHQNLAKF